MQGLRQSQPQGNLAVLSRNNVTDDRTMPRYQNLHIYRRGPSHINHLSPMFWSLPTCGRSILPLAVKSLHVQIFNGGGKAGQTPSDALVMALYHKGAPWQRDPGNIKTTRA